MYKLYYASGAASLAVHWMLIDLGVPFELVKIDMEGNEHKGAAYLKVNPHGQIPTLLIDGKPYAETAALLLHLAERHPEKRFAYGLQEKERAEFLQMLFYLTNTLQPAFQLWFYPERAAGPDNVEAAKACMRERIEASWTYLQNGLGDRRYLVGDRLTAVDFFGTMLMRWSRNMPKPAQEWPKLGSYIARMKQMPSLREVHAREGLTEWISA